MESNLIAQKSKKFAIRIVRLYQYLTSKKNEYILSKQVMRSGTSVGANIQEGLRGLSKDDFAYKLNLALKEASETAYWLELLHETDYLTTNEFTGIYNDCEELIKLLVSILKTVKNKEQK